MQGVIIAAGDVAVRRSLAAILHEGRTIHECGSVAECLALAAAHKMDYVFVDDSVEGGYAEDLARRLCSLGYGIEVVPILVSADRLYLEPFLPHGVRHCLVKPFDVRAVLALIDQVEQVVSLRPPFAGLPGDGGPLSEAERAVPPGSGEALAVADVDVREISQRFRRLLAQSLNQAELLQTFVESMQEQFDVDNVVVLFPAPGEPAFRVLPGSVADEVREQFFIPFDEPLVACLIRLGEPVWVNDHERLGRANAVTSLRYAERLGVQVLCPVLSRGRALALVGISRIHRFANSPILLSLLRLFLTFFSKALENAELFEKAALARETYQSLFDAVPMGFLAVSPSGCLTYLNPAAAALLHGSAEELLDRPIERVGSLLADAARQVLHSGAPTPPRRLPAGGGPLTVTAVPVKLVQGTGALLVLQPLAAPAELPHPDEDAVAGQERLWRDMAGAIAHNFKNAMVPVKTCAELLPERYASESFRSSFFETVTTSLNRMDAWIGKLLRFSELREAVGKKEPVSLKACIEAGLERARHQAPGPEVAVTRDYGADDLVAGSQTHLEQLFCELIENALAAVQDLPAPRLAIRTETADRLVHATIVDSGPGLDPTLPRGAYAPFTSRKGSGLGLGLAYSQRIATLHGGQLEVETAAEGGTRACVSLPLATMADSATAGSTAARPVPGDAGPVAGVPAGPGRRGPLP